jgi:hypothetical protein
MEGVAAINSRTQFIIIFADFLDMLAPSMSIASCILQKGLSYNLELKQRGEPFKNVT